LAPDFYEYAAMHKFLASLQAAFFAADRDRSGTIDAREIHNALAAAGFQVPHQTSVSCVAC
jgi:Ca2+-binding EF-hand superfamily protein